MRRHHNKIERRLFKVVAWTAGVIVLLLAGGVMGHRSFRNWQQRRLIAQANAFVNEGDFRHASLNARRLLQINPLSVEACRILARLAEKAGSNSALEWRRRVMDLGAATTSDLIALAHDGVRFDDRAITEAALRRLPESAKTTAEYHALLADIALAQRDSVEMEKQLSEAQRIEPANKDYTMRLATLWLGSDDYAIRVRGRETLVELQREPAFRRDATRYLAEDALRHFDSKEALRLARQLDGFPEKNFADRLVLLAAMQATGDPGFQSLLDELQSLAADEPERAAALITWMNAHQMSTQAVVWSAKLPPAVIGSKLVPMALADAYVTVRDWPGLERLVKSGNWGVVDFIRNALSARALREQGDETEATAQWAEAVKKVTGNSRSTMMLAETAEKWGWRNEAIDLLWVAAKDPVQGDEALVTLYRYFAGKGETQNIYRVLLHRSELHPGDRNIQNNFAQLSLLLNLNVDRVQKIARELYEKEPANAAYVSTYAFALYSQDDLDKSLEVMGTLSDAQLHQPEIAAYYGIILAAAGDHARAGEFLDLGEKAKLLPEEKALLEKARRSLAQR